MRLKLGGIFLIILLSISSSSLLVLLSEASAVACAFWRVFISTVILLSFRVLRMGSKGFQFDAKSLVYSLVSGIFLALHFLMWMESLFIIPIAVSTTVVVTYPLFSLITDRVIFKEQIGALQILGLVIGFIGVLFFLNPWVLGGSDIRGVLFSLFGALGATGYFAVGRFIRKETDLLSYTIAAYASTSLTLFVYALFTTGNLLHYSLETYKYFILLSLIPMIGGHTLINYILKYIKASVATSIALAEPIGASILASLFLNQHLDWPKIVVMVIVLASIVLTISQDLLKTSESYPSPS